MADVMKDLPMASSSQGEPSFPDEWSLANVDLSKSVQSMKEKLEPSVNPALVIIFRIVHFWTEPRCESR